MRISLTDDPKKPEESAFLYIPFDLKVWKKSTGEVSLACPTWTLEMSEEGADKMNAYFERVRNNISEIDKALNDKMVEVYDRLSGKVFDELILWLAHIKDILPDLLPDFLTGDLIPIIKQDGPHLTRLDLLEDAPTFRLVVKVTDEATKDDMALLRDEIGDELGSFLWRLYDA